MVGEWLDYLTALSDDHRLSADFMMRARCQGLGRLIFILGLVMGDYATSLDNVNTAASPNAGQTIIRTNEATVTVGLVQRNFTVLWRVLTTNNRYDR